MNKLVVGNILYRPVRSAISVLAVAIEVVMILCIVAIMVGQVQGAANQTSGIGADIMVRPPNASNFSGLSDAAVPAKIAPQVLARLPHVVAAAPVIAKLTTNGSVQTIFGIDYASYNALRPFVFLAGGPPQGPDDAIVDDLYARSHHTSVGQTIQVLSHDFRVSGIVEHGKGSRVFVPIHTLGLLNGTPDNASIFYIRTDNPKNQQAVIDEIQNTPNMKTYQVQTLAEWMSMMTPEHLPGFTIALNVVIAIAVIVGFLVIFQSMYTAVMERTREIGILKSLGASKLYVLNLVLREAILVSIAGILVGILFTQGIKLLMDVRFPTMTFLLTTHWRVYGAVIALVGSILGAIYPAFKAASKDPIDALAYE
ncbi:MAG TPA: ABC transporter permease [Acidobacteriaceae bacterium]|nr:ABC transporter permease [Acidobacteriaceae bacterium]